MKNELSFIRLYFEVWIHPRKVIQTILGNDPNYFVWPMVIANGSLLIGNPIFYFFLNKFMPMPFVFLTEVILTVGVVIIFFSLVSWFIYWMGKLMGGKGTYIEVRAAYAWCYPPIFVACILGFIEEIPNWIKVLGGETSFSVLITQKMTWQILLMTLNYFLFFWSMILSLITVAQAHKFSVWKSAAVFFIFVTSILIIEILVLVVLSAFGFFHSH